MAIVLFKINAGLSLLLGLILGLIRVNPSPKEVKKISSKLLSWSIIGLGSGLNLSVIIEHGFKGLAITSVQLVLVFILGYLFARALKMKGDSWLLITCATAICGGSAIAAVSTAIKSKADEISISLAIVFVLNAVALFIFPFFGKELSLTQYQFGLWSALAIHDTSSVVGSTMQYGAEALSTGTTFKLSRALWIVPVTFIISYFVKRTRGRESGAITYPWFILGFLTMAGLFSFFSSLETFKEPISNLARTGFSLSLFLVGTTFSIENLKNVGFKPMIHGVSVWILVSILSLYFIKTFSF